MQRVPSAFLSPIQSHRPPPLPFSYLVFASSRRNFPSFTGPEPPIEPIESFRVPRPSEKSFRLVFVCTNAMLSTAFVGEPTKSMRLRGHRSVHFLGRLQVHTNDWMFDLYFRTATRSRFVSIVIYNIIIRAWKLFIITLLFFFKLLFFKLKLKVKCFKINDLDGYRWKELFILRTYMILKFRKC